MALGFVGESDTVESGKWMEVTSEQFSIDSVAMSKSEVAGLWDIGRMGR
jgi:hypothetical protein